MENTAESMYKYFLTLIRKERTTTVSPDKWNEWINSVLLNWVKTKLPEQEFIQKRIDDLSEILTIEVIEQTQQIYGLPENYLHGINIEFLRSKYDKAGVWGKFMRTDNELRTNENPFRVSKRTNGIIAEDFIYYQILNGTIKTTYDLDRLLWDAIRLYYYRNPNQIKYDPDNSEDSTAGDFRLSQNQEVVELAARKYLERITDPRWQTYSQEQISVPS